MKISKNIRFIFFLIILFITLNFNLFSTSLSEGENFFRENQPLQALDFLKKALEENPKNPSAYNLLGLSYYQLGQYSEAIDIFVQGTTFPNNMRYTLYYNAGNAAFAMGDYNKAEQFYTSSYILKNDFAPAVLNRANSKMKMSLYEKAVEDYQLYLQLETNSSQKEQIEKLISLLKQEIEINKSENEIKSSNEEILKSEIERLLYEKENQKLEEELKKQEEAERRKRLLEEISASLEDTNSTNFSAGSEGVEEYEQNSELD